MAHARRTALVCVSVTAATLGFAAAGRTAPQPTAPTAGPQLREALSLPRATTMLTGLDVRRFVASRFYKKFAQPGAALRPTALDELSRLTGLNAETDLDRLFVARGLQNELAILATGRLDRPRLEAAWRTRAQPAPQVGLGFLSDHTLVVGSPAWVDIVTKKSAGATLGENAALLGLVAQVPADAVFWMVGDGSALTQLGSGGTRSGAAMPLGLPPLKSIAMTGDFDELTLLSITVEAESASAAQSLGDTLRGFLALAALQAQRKPALAELSAAVTVAVEGARLRLTGRLTDALIEALLPSRAAGASDAPAVPAPATGPQANTTPTR